VEVSNYDRESGILASGEPTDRRRYVVLNPRPP